MKHGDFTGLAGAYNQARPNYSPDIFLILQGILQRQFKECDAIDVGAGTGIWTRMLQDAGFRSVRAVEPNQDMFHYGSTHPNNNNIKWLIGDGEHTQCPNNSADLLTMASSFHWVNFDQAIAEFCRVLKPNGVFVALWNPRYIQNNPLLVEIESYIQEIHGGEMQRKSSGISEFTANLFNKLEDTKQFERIIYSESRHQIDFTKERYMLAWESVNDIKVQLGIEGFKKFKDKIDKRIPNGHIIKASYTTRAWIAQLA